MSIRRILLNPVINENPITVQILGLCSALAVSSALEPALIMAASVIAVLVFANLSVSLLRSIMPRSIRLILEVTLIASAVIVVDEVLQDAIAPHLSEVLSVFVGSDHHQLHHPGPHGDLRHEPWPLAQCRRCHRQRSRLRVHIAQRRMHTRVA